MYSDLVRVPQSVLSGFPLIRQVLYLHLYIYFGFPLIRS
jgi:hypothetical protein